MAETEEQGAEGFKEATIQTPVSPGAEPQEQLPLTKDLPFFTDITFHLVLFIAGSKEWL